MTKQRLAKFTIVAACVLSAATAAAQQMLANLAGTWNVNVDGPQGPVSSQLVLTQTADSLAGKFSSELGEAAVSGITWGDSARIGLTLDMGGQQLALQIVGALKDNDNMSGVVEAAGMGSFPFVAVRAK